MADVVWADSPTALERATLVVLPGSKHVAADRRWLRERGFDDALRERARRGERILAICGGLQLLGGRFDDPDGVDGSGEGVGLLPLRTAVVAEKRVHAVAVRFESLPEPWAALSGVSLTGYEIRHGSSEPDGPLVEALPGGLGWITGPILAVYLHGLFEQPAVLRALLGAEAPRSLEHTFDALADTLDAFVDMNTVAALAGIG